MKVVIDISEKRYRFLHHEFKNKSSIQVLETIVARGTPLETIKAEITREVDYQNEKINADVAKGMYMALDIIDKFTGGASDV